MSQQEASTHSRSAIIADLACIIGEVAVLQERQASLDTATAAIQGRLAKMVRDLSQTTAFVRPASDGDVKRVRDAIKDTLPALLERADRAQPATQAARLPEASPSTQDEAGSVQVGKAPDEAPAGGTGSVLTGQSGEFVTRAGAGGESAASADTAPAVDAKPKRTFMQPLTEAEKPAEPPVEPSAPRREPRVLAAGGGLVQGGPVPAKPYIDDTIRGLVLDTYAATACGGRELEAQHDLTPGTSFTVLEEARGRGDARVKQGDAARSAKLTRQPAPRPAPVVPEKPQETSGEALMIIDPKGARIIGPTGEWKRVTPVVCKSLAPLVGGDLLGIDRMMRAGGWTKDSQVIQCLPNWTAQLARIGIDLIHTKGIGVKLNRRQAAA